MPRLLEADAEFLTLNYDTLAPDKQAEAKDWLKRYKQQQADEGEPLFPSVVTRQVEQENNLRRMFEAPDKIDYDPGYTSADPMHDKMQHANMALLSARYQKEPAEVASRYDFLLNDYARQKLGASEDVDTAKFYALAQKDMQKVKLREDTQREGMSAALRGEDGVKALAAWQAKNADRAKEDAGLFMRGYQQAIEQDGEMLPIADRLLPLLEAQSTKKDGQAFDQTKAQELGGIIEQLAGMKKAQRKSVYRSIAARIEAAGYDQKGFWSQMFGELDKGLYRMAGTLGTQAGKAADVMSNFPAMLAEGMTGNRDFGMTPAETAQTDANLARRERIGNVQEEIMQIVSGELDPVKPVTGWMNETLETGLIKGPGAVAPFMAASALLGPYGAGLVFTADFAEQNRRELVQSGLDADQARKVGAMAAPLQAAVESLSNMVSLGKFPAVQAALSRFTRPVGGASLVGRYVQNSLISGATEFTEEQVQDNVVVPAMQELLGALEKDVPEVDWSFYKTRAANATPELAATLLPMALVFGGVMTAADARLSDRMTSNVDALTALNYSQAQATEIVQEKTPEARIAKAASLWRSRAGNKATLEEGAAKLAERLKALSGDAVAYQAELERRGVLPRVMHTAENDWLLTFNDGSTARFATHDEASTARWTWAEDQLGRVHALTREALTSMERNMSTNRELGVEFKPDVRMVEAGQTTPDIQRRVEQGKVLGDIDPNEAFDTASMVDRATAEADGFLSSYQILGSSRNEFKDGVLRTTIKLWEGSNVLTLVEEKLEGDAKAIVASRGGRGWMLAALRNYEQESGDKLFREVPDDQLTDDDLVEAWSHLGQSYLVGRSSFGEPLQQNNMRRFSRLLMRAGLAGALNSESTFWQAVVNRAQKLGELKAAGKLGEDVVAELEKQLGIDSQVKHEQGAMQEAQQVRDEVAQQVDTSGYSETNPGPNGETFSLAKWSKNDNLSNGFLGTTSWQSFRDSIENIDPSAKGGVSSRVTSAGTKDAELTSLWRSGFTAVPNTKEDARGGEHVIEFRNGRAYKQTHPETFGAKFSPETPGSLVWGTPLEYLQRWRLFNEIFDGADVKFEGVVMHPNGALSLKISQPIIEGPHPSIEHIQEALKKAGWKNIALNTWEKTTSRGTLLMTDAKPENFKVSNGTVVPVDVIVSLPTSPRAIPADASKVVQMPDGKPVSQETFSLRVTPAQDAEYMAAVEAGDMEKAQRMVDEAAKKAFPESLAIEPITSSRDRIENKPLLKLYHGTNADFNIFERGRIGVTNFGWLGVMDTQRHGIFFAENKDFAKTFAKSKNGNRVIEAFLNVRNPFSLQDAQDIVESRNTGDEFSADFNMANWFRKLTDQWDAFDGEQGKAFVSWLESKGYDGAIIQEAGVGLEGEPTQDVWVALFPNQIKSADPVTRDESGNVIPLSQRFNPADDRITYSLRPGDFASRVEAMFSPFQRSPEARLVMARVAKDRALRLGNELIEKANVIRRIADLEREAKTREALKADELVAQGVQEKEARRVAKQQAADWLTAERKKVGSNKAQRDRIKAWLRVLDGILAASPPEVRARVGGFVKMAGIATDEAALRYLEDRVAKLDKELEKYLVKQARGQLERIFDKARPKSDAGEKAKGKLTPELHAWFKLAEEAAKLSPAVADERIQGIEQSLASDMTEAIKQELSDWLGRPVTDDAEAQTWQETRLTLFQTFGAVMYGTDAKSERNAAEITAALDAAREAYQTGRLAHIEQLAKLREKRAEERGDGIQRVGSPYDPNKANTRKKALNKATGLKGRALDYMDTGLDASGFFLDLLGDDTATDLYETTRRNLLEAAATKADNMEKRKADFAAMLKQVFPGKGLVDRLRGLWELQQIQENAPVGTMSQLQAMQFTLWHLDPDSREWLATNGYGDEWQAKAEQWLTSEAKAVRAWLLKQYDGQYDRLNPVFRRLRGVNLPRVEVYGGKRQIEHSKSDSTASIEADMMRGGMDAGFTKTRVSRPTGRPRMTDALQNYWQNALQVEHYIAFAETVTELKAVFGHRDFLGAVETNRGLAKKQQVLDWISNIETAGTRDAFAHSMQGKLFGRYGKAVSASALLFKLATLAKQAPAAIQSAFKVGLKEYFTSLSRIMAGKGAISLGDMYRSDTVQRRLSEHDNEMLQASKGWNQRHFENEILDKAAIAPEVMMNAGWYAMGWTDARFTTISAAVAYDVAFRDGKKLGMTDDEAKAFAANQADLIVMETAQPQNVVTKSLAENMMPQALLRLVFAFQSANRQVFGLTYLAAKQGKVANAYAVAALIAGLTQTIGGIMRMMFSDDDPEELFDPQAYALGMATAPVTGMVGFGPLVEFGLNFFGVESRFSPSSAAAAKSLQDIVSGEADTKDVGRVVSMAGAALGGRGAMLGVGWSVLNQIMGLYENVAANASWPERTRLITSPSLNGPPP